MLTSFLWQCGLTSCVPAAPFKSQNENLFCLYLVNFYFFLFPHGPGGFASPGREGGDERGGDGRRLVRVLHVCRVGHLGGAGGKVSGSVNLRQLS